MSASRILMALSDGFSATLAANEAHGFPRNAYEVTVLRYVLERAIGGFNWEVQEEKLLRNCERLR